MNTNHYPDITRCKKLTEIGFPITELAIHGTGDHVRVLGFVPKDARKYYVKCCPSVMEMLDVIPENIDSNKWLLIAKAPKAYMVSYYHEDRGSKRTDIHFCDTLPNALADLIFWLVENKYLKF